MKLYPSFFPQILWSRKALQTFCFGKTTLFVMTNGTNSFQTKIPEMIFMSDQLIFCQLPSNHDWFCTIMIFMILKKQNNDPWHKSSTTYRLCHSRCLQLDLFQSLMYNDDNELGIILFKLLKSLTNPMA